MVLPMWLAGLGAAGGGFLQALQQRKDQQRQDQQQQQKLQMIQSLLGQRAQQHPGGFGATPSSYGPQNWGAQNQTSGGVVHDQWGNPIGPVGQPDQTQGGQPAQAQGSPASTAPIVTPDVWSGGGAGVDPTLPYQPPGMTPSTPIPGLGGPSQAPPVGGAAGLSGQPGGYQAPPSGNSDDAIMQALFASQI